MGVKQREREKQRRHVKHWRGRKEGVNTSLTIENERNVIIKYRQLNCHYNFKELTLRDQHEATHKEENSYSFCHHDWLQYRDGGKRGVLLPEQDRIFILDEECRCEPFKIHVLGDIMI